MNMRRLLLLATAALLFTPAAAMADGVLNFGITAPTSGSISYAGGANPLVGTSISVDSVCGVGTAANNGSCFILSNATLSFSTGNFTGSDANNWFFSGGGFITLVGGVPAFGIPDGTVLFSGVINLGGASVSTIPDGNSFHKLTMGTFDDRKDDDLVANFGFDPGLAWTGTFVIEFVTVPGALPPNGFNSSGIQDGLVTNTPVPEPTTMVLFGTGLLGLAGIIRRRIGA